ncbi:MAG: hypothetical protein WC735_04975 [Candidatus Paceibacterota bacterium]
MTNEILEEIKKLENDFRILALHLAHNECDICADKTTEFAKKIEELKSEVMGK